MVAFFIVLVLGYLGTALVTARIGADVASVKVEESKHKIYLVTSLLHADFVLPASPRILERFSFLQGSDLPLKHPDLRHLTFGWGSNAFYTTAGSYSDIAVKAVFKAVSGDTSVMRVVAIGEVEVAEDVIELNLGDEQYDKLLTAIDESFARQDNRQPEYLPSASIGEPDAFYIGVGGFNIFNPCNQWVNNVLRNAGVKLGVWTPTTQALRQSLVYFSSTVELEP